MGKSPLTWDPATYVTVAERLAQFRAAYPEGRVVTRLHSWENGRVTFRALLYRTVAERAPAATGWASEREGDGEVNRVACLENAETSAVGRALANLGFHGSRALDAERRRTGVRLVREPAAGAVPDESTDAPRGEALARAADALLDVLALVAQAERAGLSPARARRMRAALDGRSVAPSALVRVERELREWFAAHVPAPALEP